MKKLILIILIILFAVSVQAEDSKWSSSLEFGINSLVNSRNVQEGEYVEIRVQRKNFFVKGSMETNSLTFAGQSGIALEMYSLGVGFEHEFSDYFSFFMQVAYYHPVNEGTVYRWPSTVAEGLQREGNEDLAIPGTDINNPWREYFWDRYEIEHSGNFGGKIGVNFHKPWKYATLGLSGGIRFLELKESRTGKRDSFYTEGRNDPVRDGWWSTHEKQSFTAYQIGINFTIKSQFFKDLVRGRLK